MSTSRTAPHQFGRKTLPLSIFVLGLGAAAISNAAVIIDPVSAVDNGHYTPTPGASGTRTIDGTGLSNPAIVANGAAIPVAYPTTTADGSPSSFFTNYAILTLADDSSGPVVPEITYTLDQPYTITGGHFWQYSGDREATGDRSLTSASILVSTDGTTFVPAGTLVPGYVEGAYGTTDPGVDFSLTGTFANVVAVRLTALVGAGDNDVRVAFNEIRFVGTAVPEPASLGLIALGGVTLLGRRRS